MPLPPIRWPIMLARVSGPSMVPTLRDRDLVVAWRPARIRPGHVVLARYHSMADRLVVKRAAHVRPDGWWLTSDNSFAGGDSAVHGSAEVQARVLLRWRRGRIGLFRIPAS